LILASGLSHAISLPSVLIHVIALPGHNLIGGEHQVIIVHIVTMLLPVGLVVHVHLEGGRLELALDLALPLVEQRGWQYDQSLQAPDSALVLLLPLRRPLQVAAVLSRRQLIVLPLLAPLRPQLGEHARLTLVLDHLQVGKDGQRLAETHVVCQD